MLESLICIRKLCVISTANSLYANRERVNTQKQKEEHDTDVLSQDLINLYNED